MKIKLSKSQWEAVGKKAGWMKTASDDFYCEQCDFEGHSNDVSICKKCGKKICRYCAKTNNSLCDNCKNNHVS